MIAIARRRCMTQKRLLPEGYIQLDYASTSASSGAYINTGVSIRNSMIGVDCDFRLNRYVSDRYILGVSNYSNKTYSGFHVGMYKNKVVCSLYDANGPVFPNPLIKDFDTNWHHATINCLGVGLKFDDIVTYEEQVSNFGSPNKHLLHLFNREYTYGTPTNYKANGSLGITKVYANDTDLVRHYIPCISSNDVVGMYDLVEDKFYAPTGGSLEAGTITI